MDFPKKALLGSLLLMSASSVFAVDTADLKVIGRIAPTACTPNFAGGGTVDYGNIPTATLSPTAATTLGVKEIEYSISCDAAISLATSWTDARADSVTSPALHRFGLGKDSSNNNIGSYTLAQVNARATADGAPVSLVAGIDGVSWVAVTTGRLFHDGQMLAYAPLGTLVPGSYTQFAGVVQVTVTISQTDSLDLTSAITLDGLSTMTVRYL